MLLTDFNDELANATLLERPNSFFIGSAAPEDVDSDSGYSSPQHRQMASVPCDVATASVPTASPPVVSLPSQSASRVLEATHSMQQPALVSYLPDGRQLPMIYAPYPFQGAPSVNMFMSAGRGSEAHSGTPRPQSGGRRGSWSKGKHRGSYVNRKTSKQQQQQQQQPTLMSSQLSSVVNDGGSASQVVICCNLLIDMNNSVNASLSS